jgi:hypothetical protein
MLAGTLVTKEWRILWWRMEEQPSDTWIIANILNKQTGTNDKE